METQKLENDVINGFSPSFSKALLKKLKALKEEDRIFREGWEQAHENGKTLRASRLTEMAKYITVHLQTQLEYFSVTDTAINMALATEIEELISFAEEFLAIFEEEKPTNWLQVGQQKE